ncbi:MAG: 2,4-dihydroxyhept-2-ene-1,7-dioic acid aldolase [Actinobacteria bacterium]|nr:2,4-dihydroxyhept-2-ene-1,7-dioic acid aldolase [Actinomycetota bacterium]
MTYENPLLTAWRRGQPVVGAWCTLPDPFAAEIFGRQGYHYVTVDQQHGMIDDSTAFPMIQAISATPAAPVVRTRWNDPASIMSALDAGALGVVVPMIETRSDALAAVRACRYPPHGQRSYGPIRARDVMGSTDPDVLADVACIIMIETAAALDDLDSIVSTPGVDGVYIGPSDLALAIGEKPGSTAPILAQTIQLIADTCRRHGVAVGMHTSSGAVAKSYVDKGFDFVTVFSDAGLIAGAAREQLSVAVSGSRRAADGAATY